MSLHARRQFNIFAAELVFLTTGALAYAAYSWLERRGTGHALLDELARGSALAVLAATLGSYLVMSLATRKLGQRGPEDDAGSEPKSRTDAVVLAYQLQGSDAPSDAQGPRQHFQSVAALEKRIQSIVKSHGGRVETFNGITGIATWGIGSSIEGAPDRAIEACLAIRALNSATGELRIRMGLHQGPAVTGIVEGHFSSIALGTAVEAASRIQTYTDQFGVDLLVTEALLERTRRKFPCQKMLSGNQALADLYEITGFVEEKAA